MSYNFTPDLDIYSTEHGVEQDIYFYQRDDRWIFGGSRQKGTLDENGNWKGEEVKEPTHSVKGNVFPQQILKLNSEIIDHTFGKHFIDYNSIQPKIGYRFMGNSEEKLRIDAVEAQNKLIIITLENHRLY